MELLPSLAGLSLAPDAEDEALPEPTDQAPAPQAALQQLPVVLKKYSNAKRYNAGLRNWKNTRSVRDRWNQGDRPGVPMFVADRPLVNSKPRAYFEDDPDFYEGWMQVSQQECFFYELYQALQPSSRPPGGVLLIHPVQHILRVVSTCMGVSPDSLVKYHSICIVDGSNMFDVGFSEKSKFDALGNVIGSYFDDRTNVANHWNNVIARANSSPASKPQVVIGFVKAQTLSDKVNGEIANHPHGVFIAGEVVPATYDRLYQMLSKVGNRVFLVVVEDWESSNFRYVPKRNPADGFERVCYSDPVALKDDKWRGKHLYCEYDDFLMLSLREYIDYKREAHTHWIQWNLQPSTAGNGLLTQMFPNPIEDDKHHWWFKKWRTEPTMGVVTFDKNIIYNASKVMQAAAYYNFLQFSDVFRIRIFVPLQDGQNLAHGINHLMNTLQARYSHAEDYTQLAHMKDFYEELRDFIQSGALRRLEKEIPLEKNRGDLAWPEMDRAVANAGRPVTWEYSLRLDNPHPPGWPWEGPQRSARWGIMLHKLRQLGVPEDQLRRLAELQESWNPAGAV